MNNQHPVDLLPGYALAVLDEADAASVRAHVHECVECQHELQQIINEFGDAALDGPRTRVRRQLFAHINFDMDMREALREGARRTSLRWIWGAFLLVSGSIVASLLMWSGMQQREQLANNQVEVLTTSDVNAELVKFLAQPFVTSHDLIAKRADTTAVMRMYHNRTTNQAIFVAHGLTDRTPYVVWLIDDIGATQLGSMTPDTQGVAWLRAQISLMCTRCNVIVTQEQTERPTEPSNDWYFELVFVQEPQ